MRKKTLFGAGLAVLLILGFWGWQSGFLSKSRPENSLTTVPKETVSPRATPSVPSPAAMPSGQEQRNNEGNLSGSVSGTVRLKTTGDPVKGITVQVWKDGKPFENITASADEKGSYTLTNIPPRKRFYLKTDFPSVDFYLDLVDCPVFALNPKEVKTGVDIKLSQGQSGTISGTVVGRRVSYLSPDNPTSITKLSDYERDENVALPGIQVVLMDNSKLRETVTDQSGSFKFDMIRPGQYFVRAELPEGAAFAPDQDSSRCYYANLIEKPVHENIKFYFRMDGVSIEGRVTDTQGKPIAGGEVTAFLAERSNPRRGSQDLQNHRMCSVLTNDQGQYRLDKLATFNLIGGLTYLRQGEYGSEFRIECQATGYSRGQVSLPPYPPGLIESALILTERTLKDLNEESLKDFHSVDIKLPAGQGNLITGVDLVLPSSTRISGRVVDSRGRNYLSAEDEKSSMTKILLFPPEILEGKSKLGERTFWYTLGKGSRFCFEDVPPGNYLFNIDTRNSLYAMSIRARNKVLTVREGETIENLEVVAESMSERGNIAGHVVDALSGQPVESVSVEVVRVDSPDEPNPQKGYIQRQDKMAGDFIVASVSPGKSTLKISAPGYPPVESEVEVLSGQTTEQTFQLGGGGSLSGLVLDAETKEPIEAFEVKVVPGDGDGKGKPIEGTVKKNETKKGSFLLSSLPSGRVTVEISRAAGDSDKEKEMDPESGKILRVPVYSDKSEEVEITAGKTTEQTFLLERRGSVAGRVTVNGKVTEGVNVSVEMTDGKTKNSVSARTKEDGYYKVGKLNIGKCTILAALQHRCGFKEGTLVEIYDRAQVEVEAGKEVRQDFDFKGTASIKGSFRASNRDLFWHVYVLKGLSSEYNSVRAQDNANLQAVALNLQNGDRYEIQFLPPGTYTLIARCCKEYTGDTPVSEKSQTVTLTEGQSLTVNFDLP